MKFHELACSYISLQAVPWTWDPRLLMVSQGSKALHELAVPWAYMQFYELVCSSFLCLSSSQEFHSACSFWVPRVVPNKFYLKCLFTFEQACVSLLQCLFRFTFFKQTHVWMRDWNSHWKLWSLILKWKYSIWNKFYSLTAKQIRHYMWNST